MRALLASLLLLLLASVAPPPAQAAPPGVINSYVSVCNPLFPTQCILVNSDGSINISGTISASSTVHSTAAAPTYVEGTDNPFSSDLSGGLRVNCVTGCAGGSFNNNADNVATSATNGQAAAWLYVWDGAAWDRLYGDSTNGAFVNVKTSVLPTGASTAAKQPALGTAGTASTDVIT